MTTRTGTATQSTASIRLPEPRPEGPLSVERALSTRRSVRAYAAGGLGLAEVSQVLWAAQNVSLQAVSLGLGTVVVGAFADARVRAPWFSSWWNDRATWEGDPMRAVHDWLHDERQRPSRTR